jgi:hypothetical protein
MSEEEDEATRSRSEVQLCITVPSAVREAIREAAKRERVTVRTLVLRSLRDAGLVEIGDDELTDRRATVAAAKSRLYREARGERT